MNIYARAIRKLTRVTKSSWFYNREAIAETQRDLQASDPSLPDRSVLLREALDWLKRAQDVPGDRGVSRGYGVGWVPYLNLKGWQPSYPETTGYIIPTMFDCAQLLGDDDLRHRAIEMADWEVAIQMPSGAVMGGTVDQPQTPAVFNTGQVMLGWLRVLHETEREAYKRALVRAADYLVSVQDADGSWRRGNSKYARPTSTTYNSRVGWALIATGVALGNEQYIAAGERNMHHTMSLQRDNGWFAENCLDDPTAPLTHTIAYVVEGLLGAYDVLKDQRYLDCAVLTCDHVAACVDERGRLSGRLSDSWRGTVAWTCLTGSSQFAGLFFRLHRLIGKPAYADTGTRLLEFVARTQNRTTSNQGLRGGIKGSFPFDGGYGRYEVLNWATKFFIDALILSDVAAHSTVGSVGHEIAVKKGG